MLGRGLSPADSATAQVGPLLKQAGALRQQQGFEGGGEFWVHVGDLVG
jgi:hypothetical protein